jgi:outer membrane lipoprotein carrier protein
MRIKVIILVLITMLGLGIRPGLASDSSSVATPVSTAEDADLEEILAGVEARYAGAGFAADFYQASTLKAMDITDTATGRIYIKRPNKMRWEYGTPEKQTIITDGVQLWMYRPEDKQVMVGRAPTFFGDGKGAGFLADMQSIRANFVISKTQSDDLQSYRLKLIPVKPQSGLADIYLSISKGTYEVATVITHNEYEDETRIELTGYQFDQQFDDALFGFKTPPGVDVLQLDEQ